MFRIMLVFGVLLIYLFCCPLTNTDAKLLGYWQFDDKNNVGEDSSQTVIMEKRKPLSVK